MKAKEQVWWESLSPQWRQAFNVVVLQKDSSPNQQELKSLCEMQVLRFAGPTAPHSNCNIELTDLSGVAALTKLQILIISHHALTSVEELAGLRHLKSLFLFNNRITSLHGIENLHQLEQLYVNSNELKTIKEIENLPNLLELNVGDNRLTSLDGLTEEHAEKLNHFVCLPNKTLKPKEIIYAERELGIMCR